MSGQWMIYGANGYTGELTARLAIERGERPLLAGRSAAKVEALADELGLEHRVFALDEPAAVAHQIEDVDVVLHAAGPFSVTWAPMVEACLRAGTHYCDITGEIDVFEAVHARDAEAREVGVCLVPGVGFDVVPTDCLAALLADRLPDAHQLELAFFSSGAPSAGTAKSAIEALHRGGRARIDGDIVSVPAAWRSRTVPFADKARECVSIPWGDVSTAFYSTGIANITVYASLPPSQIKLAKRAAKLGFLVGSRPVQALLKKMVEWRIQGPSAEARERSRSEVWGEVRDASGETVVTGSLTAPEGYTLTADASIRAVRRLLAGDVPSGALTPSQAFGADFVRELDGVVVHAPGD